MIDDRKAAILKAVVEQYTKTAQPVGSTAAAKHAGVTVSGATVRNDMVALETEGLLYQPHTSAGRVPTEAGYRYFVDNLISDSQAMVASNSIANTDVASFFGRMQGEIEQVMSETAGLLANLTDYAAVVVDDTDEAATIRSVQLVELAEAVVMAVVVMANGQINKYTFDFDNPVSQEALGTATGILRQAFEGQVLSSPEDLTPSADLEANSIALQFLQAMSTDGDNDRVYVEGASKVAAAFEAVESVSRVLTILEQQLVVVSLLANVLERGLSVAIGSETGIEPLSECSLVVSPYNIDGERAGAIAVLGPTRMNYPQALSAVAVVSDQLGNLLSEG